MSDWKALAKEMREHGVDELTFHREGHLCLIRLSANLPPSPPLEDPKLDEDPEANKLALAAYRARVIKEDRAAAEAERQRMLYAATEGIDG